MPGVGAGGGGGSRHLWVGFLMPFMKEQEGVFFFFFFKRAMCRSRKLISPTFFDVGC